MSALLPFGENIWIADGPIVESAGFAYPTRMAIIRLDDGDLFLWSPIALTPELRAAVDALGETRLLVTPTRMHHVALPAWRAAYPDATLYAAPGSRTRAKHIAFDADLLQTFPPDWFSGWRRIVAQLDGMIGAEARVPQKFRVAFTNRRAARDSLRRIENWPIEKILMAHGAPVTENARAFLTRAFHWL